MPICRVQYPLFKTDPALHLLFWLLGAREKPVLLSFARNGPNQIVKVHVMVTHQGIKEVEKLRLKYRLLATVAPPSSLYHEVGVVDTPFSLLPMVHFLGV